MASSEADTHVESTQLKHLYYIHCYMLGTTHFAVRNSLTPTSHASGDTILSRASAHPFISSFAAFLTYSTKFALPQRDLRS